MFGAKSRQLVRDALRVRQWLHDRMLHHADAPAPYAPLDAWRLALRQERASALLERTNPRLPSDVQHALRESAVTEMRRMLAARANLALLRRLAHEHDLRILVLKSGVEIAEGRDVSVADLDVLAAPQAALRLAALLDANGFAPQGSDSHTHLAARSNGNGCSVEVHTTVAGFDTAAAIPWERVEAITQASPLFKLNAEDHVWTMLHQTATKHPERRTRLRDMLLIRSALREVDIVALHDRIAASPFAKELRHALDMALGPSRDAEQREAARAYLWLARTSGLSVEWGRTSEHVLWGATGSLKTVLRLKRPEGLVKRMRSSVAALVFGTGGRLLVADARAVTTSGAR